MLDDRTMVSIRRHLGIPAAGIPNSSFTLGIQLYDPLQAPQQQAATVETRMANLTPSEESYLTGHPVAQIALTGIPASGAALALSATPSGGSPVPLGSHTLSAAEYTSTTPLLAFAAALVITINTGNVPYTAALGPNTPGSFAVAPYASLTIASLTNQAFTIAVTTATGVGTYPAMQGTAVAMSAVLDKVQVSGLIPILDALEARIATASNYAAFGKADVVGFNPVEGATRYSIYNQLRQRLVEFIGVNVDPLGLFSGGGGAVV